MFKNSLINIKFYNKLKLIQILNTTEYPNGWQSTKTLFLSRECFLKQYLESDEKNGLSLLKNTYLRLKIIKNLNHQ